MEPYKIVPTYRKGKWTDTVFNTLQDFRDFVIPLFKEPGKYNFTEETSIFNEQSKIFTKTKVYCIAPNKSRDFIKYWDDQKDKCRNGIIVEGEYTTWYVPRDYYMWLNFLPIYDKEEAKFGFTKVRDAQYHMALYECLAEIHYAHVAILKKRQIASSYYHAAKMINLIWFEEGAINKMGASHKDYINEKGTWKFLNEYRSFLNEHTAWYRPMNPGKVMMWQQQIEMTTGNRKTTKGLKGTIQGLTFDQDPTNGVGGPCRLFFHEEAGIAPKMDTTFEFVEPAMKSGHMTTGVFVAAGSVGDLDQCQPLKSMIFYPKANSIYPVSSNLIDDKGTIGLTGLFIPEQWSMPPYIDQYGNSLVEEAIKAIDEERKVWKQDLAPDQYQLRISQHPKNIGEAFAHRKASVFPVHLISAQKKRIDDKEYPYELLDLRLDAKGQIEPFVSNKFPIKEFPITMNLVDKEGCMTVWERPLPNPVFGTYYASIDPVSEGKTTTSESLCSIIVYKNPVEVTKNTPDGPQTYVEGDKIVATWCGRFDDITRTHQKLEMIIEWYNAWTVVENNVSLFIRHMIERKKQRYLVPKTQMIFLKDIGSDQNVYQDYGWKNTGTLFKTTMLSYGVEFTQEITSTETKTDGTIVKTHFGIERIPDPMILEEMLAYQDGVNVDRLVAYCALISFVKVQQANRGMAKRVEESKEDLQKSKNLYKLNKSMFNHMGHSSNNIDSKYNIKRSAFKNLR